MVGMYYAGMFLLSLLGGAVFFYRWHRHFTPSFILVFTLVAISCLGYMLYAQAENLEAAATAMKISYIGGSFLQLFIMLSIFNLCEIQLSRPVRGLLFCLSACMYLSVLTIGHGDLFYRNMSFALTDGKAWLIREYGPLHTAFYVVLCSYFAAGIIAVVYSWFKKRQVPRTVISLLAAANLVGLASYFAGRMITREVELVPAGYVLAELIFLLIAHRVNLYNVSDTVIDSMDQERSIGYASFDFRNRYLGSNEMARRLLPELYEIAVDDVIDGDPLSEKRLLHYLESFRQDERNNQFVHVVHDPGGNEDNDRIYNVNVNYLYVDNRRHGYLVTFTDDTQNRKYIKLLDTYNEQLQHEVEQKTRHIVSMHDNLIMSLAMMVESRDNSTGGHIKRTSEGVRILIDEIVNQGSLALTPEFCRAIVKAAPMHDLGKIAVDDAVLRKPGRFTPEEFAKMKHHAEEGARVIHEILLHTDDELFKQVAENVAHFHHERWDGSGYPDGLAGNAIPIEARIMAIADVYDALVSKRVYKEAFDFAKADAIIMEGMGSQFDPGLKDVYERVRPRLEAYYSGLDDAKDERLSVMSSHG
ncbi:MAG: HD domain-containing protein [Clostridia bacterium]|nr:HD domain-containing protein [Clostridia bacterium]